MSLFQGTTQPGKTTAAVLGLVGVSLAPAFVLPSTGPGSRTALRSSTVATSPEVNVQSSGGISTMACAGVFGAAALSVATRLRRPGARAVKPVVCQAFDPSQEVGVTAPFGFFDPMGITGKIDEEEFKRLRACEIRHARAAMMASIGLAGASVYQLPGYEKVPPGLDAQWTEPGSSTLLVVFFLIGCLELGLGPWKENPANPGDYGDPLNLGNYSTEMRNKELNNGRFAMFATIGILSADAYTHQAGLAQFAVAAPKNRVAGVPLCGSSAAAGLVSRRVGVRADLCARQAFDGTSLPGASKPLGYFDPLKLSRTQEDFDKFRASEVKHGRVAMLAILGAIVQHWAKIPGVPSGMQAFSDPVGQKGVVSATLAAAILELGPWADNNAKSPGDFGDPCGFAKDFGYEENGSEFNEMKTKELNNGRLAMMATMGMIAAEVTTGNTVTDLPSQLGF